MSAIFSLPETQRITKAFYDNLYDWVRGDLLRPVSPAKSAAARRGGIYLDSIGVAMAAICAVFRQRSLGRLPVAAIRPVADFLYELGEEGLRAEIEAGKTALVFGGEDLPPRLCTLSASIRNTAGGVVLFLAVDIGRILEAIDNAIGTTLEPAPIQEPAATAE